MGDAICLSKDESVLLASDIHLSAEDPDLTQIFISWLDGARAMRPTWLMLLGDLVDVWVGDDQIAATDPTALPWPALRSALAAHLDQGTAIGIMVGNRDFLMGEAAAKSLGATVLDEFVRLRHPAVGKTLLCHGDQLCLEDTDYQAFRSLVRAPDWQKAFLSRDLADRLEQARLLRMRSEHDKQPKAAQIMDIAPTAAMAALDAHDCGLLIHGHTHRPGQFSLPDGRTRWVLPDWGTLPSRRGGGLLIDGTGIHAKPLLQG